MLVRIRFGIFYICKKILVTCEPMGCSKCRGPVMGSVEMMNFSHGDDEISSGDIFHQMAPRLALAPRVNFWASSFVLYLVRFSLIRGTHYFPGPN